MADDPATVDLPIADARNLLRACQYAEQIPGLSASWLALRRAIEAAQTTGVMEKLRAGLNLDDFYVIPGTETMVRRPSTRPRPQWSNVAKATHVIADIVAADPAYGSRADALGAYIRDTWDALGLSLYDEDTLYVSLTMAGLLVEMADNGRQAGMVRPDVVEAIAAVAQTFTAAVLPYLPKEATS